MVSSLSKLESAAGKWSQQKSQNLPEMGYRLLSKPSSIASLAQLARAQVSYNE